MRILFFILPVLLFSQSDLICESLLFQAEKINEKYNNLIAKTPPPAQNPKPIDCLNVASIWLMIDLEKYSAPAFEKLDQETLWNLFGELGIQGIFFKNLKKGGTFRTGMDVDHKYGDFEKIYSQIQKKQIALITDTIFNATGLGSDFFLALKNYKNYPSLFQLIEIDEKDWKLLPNVSRRAFAANVSWLELQKLQKKGYVPTHADPFVKQSDWMATAEVEGFDKKIRRWIYLTEKREDPVINWLNSSFTGYKIAAADILDSSMTLKSKIMCLDSKIDAPAQESLVFWTRKLGRFSVLNGIDSILDISKQKTDLVIDTLSRSALLHAILTEDAECLKWMYRIFLDERIDLKRWVHVLQPFDRFSCDYKELIHAKNQHLKYYDEILTAETLRARLMKEDSLRLIGEKTQFWPSICEKASALDNLEKDEKTITNAHYLLAFFYAMQPGAFALSGEDLIGLKKDVPYDLMEPNAGSLYGSLPSQMLNRISFARNLQTLLSIRTTSGIDRAKLISILNTRQKGLLVLLFELEGSKMLQMLAVNFSKNAIKQNIEIVGTEDTSAIDLFAGLNENKALHSNQFELKLAPLSGKVIQFQPKYFP